MADIFISYANEDRESAAQLARTLETAGWRVWWDRRIPAGRTWRAVLEGRTSRDALHGRALVGKFGAKPMGRRRGGGSAPIGQDDCSGFATASGTAYRVSRYSSG